MYIRMFGSSRDICTPSRMTSGGSLLVAAETRFCTLTASTLGSVPSLKTTFNSASPSLPASLSIYFMPGTPLRACSNGMMTDFTSNSLLAPGYSAVTFTLGGEIDGNCVIGRLKRQRIPIKAMTSAITMDRTGRRINILNIYLNSDFVRLYCLSGAYETSANSIAIVDLLDAIS